MSEVLRRACSAGSTSSQPPDFSHFKNEVKAIFELVDGFKCASRSAKTAQQLADFARTIGVSETQCRLIELWDDDEIRGLDDEIIQAQGFDAKHSQRIVEKSQELIQQREVDLPTPIACSRRKEITQRLRSLVLAMVTREDELRLCDETQRKYRRIRESGTWKDQVTEGVQHQVAVEFGFENPQDGIDLIRSARAFFPQDEEIRNAAHYLRNNIMVPCPLSVGKLVPEIPLYCYSTTQPFVTRSLLDIVTGSSRPTVLVAGSYT
eukprot:c2527_g1_i1.p1 GENE.c2527_g1_i1~~c2527_g1_i1.p1  ORF type:complete len:264 (+),score=60.81 c2527_g1_i1:38-829(+)